jgi:glycosyltransferase involved in cell wall biosynthesis
MGKPCILIAIPSLTTGGSERQALFYAKAIRDQGVYDPILLSLGREGELGPIVEKENIRKVYFSATDFWSGGLWGRIWFIFRFYFFVRSFNPQYLLALTHWPCIFCGLVFRFTRARAFYWNQGSVDSGLPLSKWEWLIARLFKPRYLANGANPAAFIAQRHHLKEPIVRIINNAIELPSRRQPDTENGLNIIMLAHFFPEKDHETLIKAVAAICESVPEIRLHLVGSAPGTSSKMLECKALAFDLGLMHHVVFHGAVANPHDILRTANIGILSTRSEGYSNALMEYMAFGLPVLATDIAPNREALGDVNTPWLFPIGDVETLSNKLKTLCLDEALRIQLGQQNRNQAEQRFSLMQFNLQVQSLFS